MTAVAPISRRGRRLLARFNRAAQDYAIRGSFYPEDSDAAVAEYEAARVALEQYMREQEARGR